MPPLRAIFWNDDSPLVEDDSAKEGALSLGRERVTLGKGKIPVVSRTILIPTGPSSDDSDTIQTTATNDDGSALSVTVWEMEHPSEMIQAWWSVDESERRPNPTTGLGDPFGVVMWPGSILASSELARRHDEAQKQHVEEGGTRGVEGATVLVIGAGTGVEAQCAAALGAKKVIATDINRFTLKLLDYGAKRAGMDKVIEARYFDIFSDQPLPKCDIILAADVLYNERLAAQVGVRLREALTQSSTHSPPKVIVTDSQRFHGTDFLVGWDQREVSSELPPLKWETRVLKDVCGSGVLIEGDQVYDAETRMISWGWD